MVNEEVKKVRVSCHLRNPFVHSVYSHKYILLDDIVLLLLLSIEWNSIRWSCPLKSDQNCTQNSARVLGGGLWEDGVVAQKVLGVKGVYGRMGVQGPRGWWGSRGL